MPTERQTLIDLLVAKDLVEAEAVKIRWVPTTHQLADMLTKAMKPRAVTLRLLQRQEFCLVQTAEEAKVESHRAALRVGQRQRRKERMKSANTS